MPRRGGSFRRCWPGKPPPMPVIAFSRPCRPPIGIGLALGFDQFHEKIELAEAEAVALAELEQGIEIAEPPDFEIEERNQSIEANSPHCASGTRLSGSRTEQAERA